MKLKKFFGIATAATLFISMLAGCAEKETTTSKANIDIDFGKYKDVEDIPSWTGKKLNVKVWQDTNSVNAYLRYNSTEDAFTPEFERVTGVHFDSDESMDNGGNSFDAMITQVIAAGDFPQMAESIPELSELSKADLIYDVKPYVEKYCPNIMKFFGPDTVFGTEWESQEKKYGGMYALPLGNNAQTIRDMVKKDGSYDLTDEQIDNIAGLGTSEYGYVYIREDVLKKLYPQAHTNKELEEIFNKNKKFTKEEIFDVPIESPQDYIDMLYRIKDMDLKDETGKVYTTFTHNGSDNWLACTDGGAIFGYNCSYFSYVDVNDLKMHYTYKEDWFKDVLKIYNKMIRDGIVPTENLMDTAQNHKEKLSNARYAVSPSPSKPDVSGLKGKYDYRKVYLKYTQRYDKYLQSGTHPAGLRSLSFFKKSLTESELIQLLRAVDFCASLPGQKLTYWGSKAAGLYTEKNGKLRYKDEKLAKQMILRNEKSLIEKYGLDIGTWPGHPFVVASCYNPKAFYPADSNWESAFSASRVASIQLPVTADPDIYTNTYTSQVEGAKKFWNSRNAFEDALLQVFAASNDSQFEARYKDMIKLAERNGHTAQTLKEAQKVFDEENAPYIDNIKEFRKLYKK